jgi:hypothetical protein
MIEINDAMDQLYKHIMNNSEEKIKDAAMKGIHRCTLYEFKKGEMFQGFQLIFLTRGPMYLNNNIGGFKYFEQNNIRSYIIQLQNSFPDYRIVFKTNKSGDTMVDVLIKNRNV